MNRTGVVFVGGNDSLMEKTNINQKKKKIQITIKALIEISNRKEKKGVLSTHGGKIELWELKLKSLFV